MKSAILLIVSLATAQHASAICNICNDNGIACISDKNFYRCQNGQPNRTRTYSCLGEKICTRLAGICLEQTNDTVRPGCGDTSNCGICDASEGTFACTSRSTYTICLNGALTEARGTCPEGQMCDIARGQTGQIPCVPNCREPTIQFCDRLEAVDVPIETTEVPTTITVTEDPSTSTTASTNTSTTTSTSTTTTAPTTTTTAANITVSPTPTSTPATTNTTTASSSTTTQDPGAAFCLRQSAGGRYAVPNDTTCRNYIFCFWQNSTLQAKTMACPNNTFFNSTSSVCRAAKPQGCI